ncbi:MAG: S1 family peptidase [Actinomycetota bacterium]|nr:S1 family peptidase [Actinomycetota bacterium]
MSQSNLNPSAHDGGSQPGGGQYQPPNADDQSEDANVGYAILDASLGEDPAIAETAGDPLSGVRSDIAAAFDEVSNLIKSQVQQQANTGPQQLNVSFDPGATTAQAMGADTSLIQAVAIGPSVPGAGEPGQQALYVFTSEEVYPDAVRSILAQDFGVSALSGGEGANVPIATRKATFEALEHKFRQRPAFCGISVGNFRITAGTIGQLCRGRTAPRNARLMILSNNHVLANSFPGCPAQFGDCIAQPGPADGGKCPQDQVAILERAVPLNFQGGTNFVDGATAWAWPDRVHPEHIFRSGNTFGRFKVGTQPIAAQVGMIVGKSGRTTQLTQGRVTSLTWSGRVSYRQCGTAFFERQILVESNIAGREFSAPGDSGSCVWAWRSGLPPVGLLFAGGGGHTIINPMAFVLQLLDVNLV